MDMNNGRGIAWGSGGCWVEGGKAGEIRTTVIAQTIKYNLLKISYIHIILNWHRHPPWLTSWQWSKVCPRAHFHSSNNSIIYLRKIPEPWTNKLYVSRALRNKCTYLFPPQSPCPGHSLPNKSWFQLGCGEVYKQRGAQTHKCFLERYSSAVNKQRPCGRSQSPP